MDKQVSKKIKIENKRRYLIRVFKGGQSDVYQGVPFSDAMTELQQEYRHVLFDVEWLDCVQLKRNRWSIKEFVDWLIEPDVVDMHFIIGHIHQGIILCGNSSMDWKMEELYNEILRLRDHNGFPTGDQLLCPMFTQDKFQYLGPLLDVGFVNPSLRIPLTHKGDDFECYRSAITE